MVGASKGTAPRERLDDGGVDKVLFHVLGPLEARGHEGAVLELGAGKPATVLATLLLHPNAWVRADQLIEATWHEQVAPASAEANLKTYVSNLRRVLPTPIDSRPGAYRLRVEPAELDARWVEEQAAVARRAIARGSWAAAVPALEESLALWRGEPYEGLAGETAWAAADRLGELHRELREMLAEARLALGQPLEAIDALRELTTEDPLREDAWTQLVTALLLAGRRSEALAAYRRARSVLAEELGVEPGPALVEAHRKALAGAPRFVAQRELPREVTEFVGREREMAVLRSAPVVVIDGMTGVGKTALAVHAAYELAPRFPDGQFFVDLRTSPEPGEVLGRLLRGIGVANVPSDVDERAARWRSELTRRRVLLVLDDAVDDRQVRPLLPGASASSVLITTRNRGWRLECAEQISLAPLDDHDSAELLGMGARSCVDDVVRACGGLPGALRAAATRLQTRPLWTGADLAEWVAELGLFEEVSAQLSPAELNAFRALGELPAEFDVRLAARTLGLGHAETRRLLESLVDRHLLDVTVRYRTHPLIRAQACQLAALPRVVRIA
jgi:DNA-binding SARP family transcriptional activator